MAVKSNFINNSNQDNVNNAERAKQATDKALETFNTNYNLTQSQKTSTASQLEHKEREFSIPYSPAYIEAANAADKAMVDYINTANSLTVSKNLFVDFRNKEQKNQDNTNALISTFNTTQLVADQAFANYKDKQETQVATTEYNEYYANNTTYDLKTNYKVDFTSGSNLYNFDRQTDSSKNVTTNFGDTSYALKEANEAYTEIKTNLTNQVNEANKTLESIKTGTDQATKDYKSSSEQTTKKFDKLEGEARDRHTEAISSITEEEKSKKTVLEASYNEEKAKIISKYTSEDDATMTKSDKEALADLDTQYEKDKAELREETDKALAKEKKSYSKELEDLSKQKTEEQEEDKKTFEKAQKEEEKEANVTIKEAIEASTKAVKQYNKAVDEISKADYQEEVEQVATLLSSAYDTYKEQVAKDNERKKESEQQETKSIKEWIISEIADDYGITEEKAKKKFANSVYGAYIDGIFDSAFKTAKEQAKANFNKTYEEITASSQVDISDMSEDWQAQYTKDKQAASDALEKMRSHQTDYDGDNKVFSAASQWWEMTFNEDTLEAWRTAFVDLGNEVIGRSNDTAKDITKDLLGGLVEFDTWSDLADWGTAGKNLLTSTMNNIFKGDWSTTSSKLANNAREIDVVGSANKITPIAQRNAAKVIKTNAATTSGTTLNSCSFSFTASGKGIEVDNKGKNKISEISSKAHSDSTTNKLISEKLEANKKYLGQGDESTLKKNDNEAFPPIMQGKFSVFFGTKCKATSETAWRKYTLDNELAWANTFFAKRVENLLESEKVVGGRVSDHTSIFNTQLSKMVRDLDFQMGYYLAYFTLDSVPYVENGSVIFYIDKISIGTMKPAESTKINYGDSTLSVRVQGNGKGDSKISWEMREDTFTTFRSLLRSKTGIHRHNGVDDKAINKNKLNLHVIMPIGAVQKTEADKLKFQVAHIESSDLRIIKLPGLNFTQESKQPTTKVEAACRKSTMTFESWEI